MVWVDMNSQFVTLRAFVDTNALTDEQRPLLQIYRDMLFEVSRNISQDASLGNL